MAAIEAATDEYAFAEAALMLLTQLRDDPRGVAATDLVRFAEVLHQMDAPDIAAALAREASGFWIVENSAIIAE
jgi:hypothetical protein